MPRIEIEDGVINVENYDGVRTRIELLTQLNAGIGVTLLVAGFIQSSGVAMKFGVFMLVVAALSLVLTRSVKVQVSRNGAWQVLGRFTLRKADEVKTSLIAAMIG